MKKYALIGKNIQDSLSPVIYESFGCQYDLLDIEEDQLEWALQQDYDGFNVTAPYKEKIIPYLDVVQYISHEVQAVNVVKKSKNRLHGFNSDYYGFLNTIREHDINVAVVGILGNGGVAKAVAYALSSCTRRMCIQRRIDSYNYTEEDFKGLTGLVNCTPCQELDLTGLPLDAWVMDVGYRDNTFINYARKRGHYTFNGFGMLYKQAKESQRIWNM